MTTEKEPSCLLEAIARISAFSYEPLVHKYPLLKEYLKKHKDPKEELTLWMTAAGAAYALVTEEAYAGEHNEIINSILTIDGLHALVKDCSNLMLQSQDNERQRTLALPVWIISRLKDEKPTMEDIEGLGIDIAKLLDSCVRDYEAKKLNIE
jgi:hypothetical protein